MILTLFYIRSELKLKKKQLKHTQFLFLDYFPTVTPIILFPLTVLTNSLNKHNCP